ncbi:hypothetical protein HHI36_015825 [Cryptolaemus montrouzieri]|uniref:Uncharacterized protein n=1 Tax=Cryptolaemus montrouzieri TaxID=559131 RepID=A0ABD2N7K3_9CUCU
MEGRGSPVTFPRIQRCIRGTNIEEGPGEEEQAESTQTVSAANGPQNMHRIQDGILLSHMRYSRDHTHRTTGGREGTILQKQRGTKGKARILHKDNPNIMEHGYRWTIDEKVDKRSGKMVLETTRGDELPHGKGGQQLLARMKVLQSTQCSHALGIREKEAT